MNLLPSTLKRKSTMGSRYRVSEIEQIIANIRFVAEKMGDDWRDFSAEDYKNICTHNVSSKELEVLDFLAGETKEIVFHLGSGSTYGETHKPCLVKKNEVYSFIFPDFILLFS